MADGERSATTNQHRDESASYILPRFRKGLGLVGRSLQDPLYRRAERETESCVCARPVPAAMDPRRWSLEGEQNRCPQRNANNCTTHWAR